MPPKNIAASFTNYLRKASKLHCPISGCGDEFPDIDERIKAHLQLSHSDLLESESIDLVVRDIKRGIIPKSDTITAMGIAPDTPLEHPISALIELLSFYQVMSPDSAMVELNPLQSKRSWYYGGAPVIVNSQDPLEKSFDPQVCQNSKTFQSPSAQDEGSPGTSGGGVLKYETYQNSENSELFPFYQPEGDGISPYKRRKSLGSSINGRPWSSSPVRRSRARVQKATANDDLDFRWSPQLCELWSPDATTSLSSGTKRPSQPSRKPTQLIRPPETRPISQEQLIVEVKGIYAGLVMVESKCIEVDKDQLRQNETQQLSNEQWQALIALHRTLLHEHHDFFLASQHPSASAALRRLASKCAMPARMWRHGIHSFLELLRHRLPHSLEHMIAFIYSAYSMMALLYETVPAFEDTWIECLGDLGRYRMAIEDDDIRDREVWTFVSQHWYSKASDKSPSTGRFYHHLAILAKPNPLQQLYYYTKSLCVPFSSAQESIMTLFDPILDPTGAQSSPLTPIDIYFVKAHGILFDTSPDHLPSIVDPPAEWPTSTVNGYVIGTAWIDRCVRLTRKWLTYDWTLRDFRTKPGSLVRSLRPLLLTSMFSHLPMVSASPTQQSPNIQEVKPHDPLAFIIAWYTCLLGVVGGYIILAIHHRDKWSFLGLGMGVSAWAYLVMVLVGDVPLDVIVSAGIVCAVFTSMWTSYDLDESGMRKSRQQLAKYCIVIGAVLLDVTVSFFLAPTSNPLLGAQKPPSPGLMMAVLAVPCATLSVVLCKTVRTVVDILAEPEAQLAEYPAPNQ